MKTKRKEKRNKKIREDIRTYKKMGFQTREAIELTAEKWFLQPGTVKLIWYENGYYNGDKNEQKKKNI